MPNAMPVLPDANFWLALAWEGHQGHPVARAWWETAKDERILFCRITQMALLRHLTSRAVMGDAQKSQADAWKIFDALCGSPRVDCSAEPADLEVAWRRFSSRASPSHKRWTDDYLAASALATGARVLTFDADFKTYTGLKTELLTMPVAASVPIS